MNNEADTKTTAEQSPVAPTTSFVSFWLQRSDQLFLGILVSIAAVTMSWQWLAFNERDPSSLVEIERLEPQRLNYQIDINAATRTEWMQLAGIGETLADRIMQHRTEHGDFSTVDELTHIKGIGNKTLTRIRPFLRVVPKTTALNPQ